jgi:hypothetical protein
MLFGHELKARRNQVHLTQGQMAAILGVERSTYGSAERGGIVQGMTAKAVDGFDWATLPAEVDRIKTAPARLVTRLTGPNGKSTGAQLPLESPPPADASPGGPLDLPLRLVLALEQIGKLLEEVIHAD